MKLEHPALTDKDRPFIDTVLSNSLADEKRIRECLDLLVRARDLGLRLELWEILRDRGVLGEGALASARSVAGARREELGPPAGASLDATREEERRLGDMAVANFLISECERDEALAAQKDLAARGLALPLGRVLVDRGCLQRPVVEGLLYLQRVSRGRGDSAPVSRIPTTFDEEDLRFGQMAVENGLIGRSDLGAALREQAALAEKGIVKRIGQVAYERGSMSVEAVRSILRMQSARTGGVAEEVDLYRSTADGVRIGEVLERNRLVVRPGVDRALRIQSELRAIGIVRPLGQILVDLGLVDRHSLEATLEVQAARRDRSGPGAAVPAAESPVMAIFGGLVVLVLVSSVYLYVDRNADATEPGAQEEFIAGGQTDHRRLLESADRRIANHEYAGAVQTLERLLPRIRVPEWSRQASRRLEAAQALSRVLDELVARIDERPVQVLDLGDESREVVRADRARLVVRKAGESQGKDIPWPNVGPEALARLFEAYGVEEQNPEGVLRFHLEHGLDQRADRLAVSILRRSPDRRSAVLALVGQYRGIIDPEVNLEVVDGRLVRRGR